MAWNDRLLEAKYTSPSGKEFSFVYGDVSKETDLKTATFTFPEKDGALVQSLGRGGRRFPLTCSFYGADCMELADAFEAGLCETGTGELVHPVYGTFKVVPTGSIKRTDSVVSAANLSTVEVTFSETLTDSDEESGETATIESIESVREEALEAAADEFAETVSAENASEQIKLRVTLKDTIEAESKIMGKSLDEEYSRAIAAAGDKVSEAAEMPVEKVRKAHGSYSTMKSGALGLCDEIGGRDFSLEKDFLKQIGEYLLGLIGLPSDILSDPASAIGAFGDLFSSLGKVSKNEPDGKNDLANAYAAKKLSAAAAVCGMASGLSRIASRGGFSTRESAVNAASALGGVLVDYTELLDRAAKKTAEFSGETDVVSIESSEVFCKVQELVHAAEKYILSVAFSLSSKRTIFLDEDRQILELLSELYGNLDRMDEFIKDNNLNADEIELIPMGREVSYYV